MSQIHIHLLITHLPIFGSILGALVLTYGLLSRSNDTKIAAYLLFILSSIGAGISFITGEETEETVENIQGVVQETIKAHEEFALIALISLIILGFSSIIGIYLTYRNSPLSKTTAIVILFISLVSFGIVARTGYLGGQIRHTEISNRATVHSENAEVETDD